HPYIHTYRLREEEKERGIQRYRTEAFKSRQLPVPPFRTSALQHLRRRTVKNSSRSLFHSISSPSPVMRLAIPSGPQSNMTIRKLGMLLLAIASWVAATTNEAAAARSPEKVLLSWTPYAPNGLSLRPTDPPNASSLLSWWRGFNTALIEESRSGITFTQDPFTVSTPATPATTTSAPATLDHVKHLAFAGPVNVSATGRKLSYAIRMTAQMTIPSELPYKVLNPLDDFRLASCAVVMADFVTMMVADMFLTNTGIWALYERLPFARTDTYDYAAFIYTRRIATRVNSWQVHDLQISYNPTSNTLEWWVDGKLKHSVSRLGMRPSGMRALFDLGGAEEVVTPASFSLGFGCFSILDGADPNARAFTPLATTGLLDLNPTAATGSAREVYALPRTWQVDTRSNATAAQDLSWRLFGQGTSLTVSAFKVSYK
ncbi:hypothetical protein VaNZ11_001202, partial [Volvox africanus]